MKVRANLGMPKVAPVNGRNLDATDVVYSWERWTKTGTNRSELANDVNPNAPVLSLTSTDARTVVVKLKSPIASILSSFGNQASGWMFIYPKEAESGFDMRRTPIGGGAYYISDYTPSSRFVYSRNPNYFDKNTAFADKIEVPIVSEYATRPQPSCVPGIFTGTPCWRTTSCRRRRTCPSSTCTRPDPTALGVTSFFGFQPGDKTPFRDVRLRQAWSMALDRDLFLSTFGNVETFKAQGVPVDVFWNGALPQASFKGWWLDPQGKDFGPNASYFQHNLAESKKLLAAAGFANGLTVTSNQISDQSYGPLYAKYIEVLEGMTGEAGFKFDKKLQGYATNWMPEFRDGHGYFDGVAYRLTPYPADPGDAMYSAYNKGGGIYYGFDADGKGTPKGQPFTGDPTCRGPDEQDAHGVRRCEAPWLRSGPPALPRQAAVPARRPGRRRPASSWPGRRCATSSPTTRRTGASTGQASGWTKPSHPSKSPSTCVRQSAAASESGTCWRRLERAASFSLGELPPDVGRAPQESFVKRSCATSVRRVVPLQAHA